jgi:predicted AlkP superfamily pyrophosphatase or phosphodiesterase
MRKTLLCVLLAACLASAAPKKPKLVVAIVIDQFRYDYLTRFRQEYTGGLNRLLNKGAVFTNARYIHMPVITAPGHATVLTGATPSISGITANDWFDREEGQHVTSVSDGQTQLLGGGVAAGSSPKRLLVSTVGDELKMAAGGKSRIIGISLKDRAAILPAGHMADGAFWFDPKTGNFVSSTYYFPQLPGWAKDFNAGRRADKYANVTWLGHKMPEGGDKLFAAIDASPFGNELIEQFAERALQAEQLGRRESIDLLAVSFSSNDFVGHEYGPDSPEVHDVSVRTDRLLDTFLQAVERQVGADNVLVVFTADHGVAPVPEVNAQRKMPGGRIDPTVVKARVQAALVAKYGAGEWVAGNWSQSYYLDQGLIARKKLDLAEVQREGARAIAGIPHIFRVYTQAEMVKGEGLADELTRRVANGFHVRRGPDIEFVPDPYYVVIVNKTGTSHGTPFSYDTHVPVIFMGAGIRPGRYQASIAVNDIAPTLAAILEIETPSGSVGRVLSEILLD